MCILACDHVSTSQFYYRHKIPARPFTSRDLPKDSRRHSFPCDNGNSLVINGWIADILSRGLVTTKHPACTVWQPLPAGMQQGNTCINPSCGDFFLLSLSSPTLPPAHPIPHTHSPHTPHPSQLYKYASRYRSPGGSSFMAIYCRLLFNVFGNDTPHARPLLRAV